MTVQELIEKLSQFPGDREVEIAPVIYQTGASSVESEPKYSEYTGLHIEYVVVIS